MVRKTQSGGRMTSLVLYPADDDTFARLKNTGKPVYRTKARTIRYAVDLLAQAEGVA